MTGEQQPLGTFSLDAALTVGWQTVSSRYGPLLGVTTVFLLISFVGSMIAANIPFGGLLFNIFLGGPLAAGMLWWTVLAARGEEPPFGTLFAAFSSVYWRMAGIAAIITVAMWVAFLIPAFVGGLIGGLSGAAIAGIAQEAMSAKNFALPAVGGAILLGIGLGALVSLSLMARLLFASVCLLDPSNEANGVGSSIAASWDMTRNNWLGLMAMVLLLIVLMCGSCLLLCVGYFLLGVPLYMATVGGAYYLLRGN